MGSMVYLGFVIGNFTGIYLFEKYKTKHLIIAACFLFGGSTLLFILGNNIALMCLARVFTGFAQVFMAIFMPVWVDSYGKKSKTILLTLLNLGVLLGFFFGYIFTAIAVLHMGSWRYAFWLQVLVIFPMGFIMLLFYSRELDIRGD